MMLIIKRHRRSYKNNKLIKGSNSFKNKTKKQLKIKLRKNKKKYRFNKNIKINWMKIKKPKRLFNNQPVKRNLTNKNLNLRFKNAKKS